MTAPLPNELTVRFRGARGSLPSPLPGNMGYGGNTSCVEVRAGDQLLILDAGSGLRLLGQDLLRNSGASPIEATLLLSHAHWDHIQGLPFFAPGYSPLNRIRVLGAHGHAARLQAALVSQMSPLHFPVGLEQMRGLGPVEELSPGVTDLGFFKIRTTELNHPGGCTGFRLGFGNRSIGYLPDHEPYGVGAPIPHRQLVEFVRGLDLLILDTQYTAEEYQCRLGWGHGCLVDSVELALEAGVRELVLFHHDPSHDDQRINQMLDAARNLASRSNLIVDAASENRTMTLKADLKDQKISLSGEGDQHSSVVVTAL